jgi:hypothetical protein
VAPKEIVIPETINLDTLIRSCTLNKKTVNRFEQSGVIPHEETKQSDLGGESLKLCDIPRRSQLFPLSDEKRLA